MPLGEGKRGRRLAASTRVGARATAAWTPGAIRPPRGQEFRTARYVQARGLARYGFYTQTLGRLQSERRLALRSPFRENTWDARRRCEALRGSNGNRPRWACCLDNERA